MALFRYRAVAPDGDTVEGEVEAADRTAAARLLQEAAYTPIRIADPTEVFDESPWSRLRAKLLAPVGGTARLARREAERLPAGLAALIRAGVALEEGLGILADAAERAEGRAMMERLRAKVRGGRPLSEALAAEGALFDRFAVALTEAGEAGGRLDHALGQLAAYRARAGAVLETVRSALIYPAVLVCFGIFAIAAMMAFVIPEFERLFREGGRDLPFVTRLVFGTAALARDLGWVPLLAGLGAWFWLRRRLGDPDFHRRFDERRLRWPLYGRMRLLVDSERFARALGALLRNGVDAPGALALAGRTLGNRALAGHVAAAATAVREGGALSSALSEGGRFPPLLTRMIRVGVETGRLPDLLDEAAEIFAREIETRAKRLVSILEPALIIGIGGIVAVVILSVLSAIVGLNALAL